MGDAMHRDTILVVDDDADVRYALATVLGDEGFHTLSASNGLEALQVLEGHHVDLIVLDVMMPIMDGWHFLSARLRHPEIVAIPIILMSARTDLAASASMVAGAAAFAPKPFHLDQLLSAIALAAA
jgi:two-component system, chemotaxis family, chemotaxis protein CheY